MLFAFDLDGTILDSKHRIHQDNIKAIKELRNLGHLAVFISGRPFNLINPFNQDKMINYIVSNNGSTIYRVQSDEFIQTNFLSRETIKKVYKIAKERKALFSIGSLTDDFHYDFSDNEVKLSIAVDSKGETFYRDLTKFKELVNNLENVTQVTFSSNKAIPMAEFKKLKSQFPEANPILSNFRFFDVVPKGINKYKALSFIMELEGFKNSELITFGDSLNDLEMIKYAGKGFAMSNACDEIKKVSTKVIGNRDSNTISLEIMKLI